MPNAYFEAYNFFTSSTMLAVDDDVQAKKFAEAYAERCSTPGRLTQKFYDDAYAVAYDQDKLNLDEETQRKRFVRDFALTCYSASLITDQAYRQLDEFARSVEMMNLDDLEARKFIYRFLLTCGRENYLTQHNFEKLKNYAMEKLNKGIIEAEEMTRQFFLEFKSL